MRRSHDERDTSEVRPRADDEASPATAATMLAGQANVMGPGALQRALQRRMLQRAASAPAVAYDPDVMHAAAERGTRGPAEPLPHLDPIQRSFGRHDVTGIAAHTDAAAGAAAHALGAEAFASGRDVAFASSPSLHIAAHEAAHVVQQRAGVHLAGGVGQAGDVHEAHADAVADRVVAGESAEALLDDHAAGPAAAAGAVQRKISVAAIDDGAEFDTEVDYVQSSWGFTAAEQGIYRRWLKDGETHAYPTKAALQAAIHRVAIQPFGTDIAASYESADEQVTIFKQALEAGYRVFDTAYTYETLDNLWKAAQALHIPRDQLTIVYKLKPADDEVLDQTIATRSEGPQDQRTKIAIDQAKKEKVSAKLEHAAEAMDGQFPDVLMVHDVAVDGGAVPKTIARLAALVKSGKAKALGVSNVSVPELDWVRPIAQEAGAPIRYVQNRCSPYHRDDDVREYCAAADIQYMAYGMMGSAQVGACAGVGDEGEGLPTQYLLARHDPRLKALAARVGISEGELLNSWAQQRGILPVSFTSRPDQAKKNFDRAATPLPAELSAQLEEMFVRVNPGQAERVEALPADRSPLKALYQSYPDPTAWSILDELRTAGGGEALLNGTAEAIVRNAADAPTQRDVLKNFALNLVRHVADIESVIQRMQNERDQARKRNQARGPDVPAEAVPAVPFTDWRDKLIPVFKFLAAAASSPGVFEVFCTWAKKRCEEGHTMGHAMEKWDEIALPAEPAKPKVVVAAASGSVTLSYGASELFSSAWAFFEDDEEAQLAVGDLVYYKGVAHAVVDNQVSTRQLVIKPS